MTSDKKRFSRSLWVGLLLLRFTDSGNCRQKPLITGQTPPCYLLFTLGVKLIVRVTHRPQELGLVEEELEAARGRQRAADERHAREDTPETERCFSMRAWLLHPLSVAASLPTGAFKRRSESGLWPKHRRSKPGVSLTNGVLRGLTTAHTLIELKPTGVLETSRGGSPANLPARARASSHS